MNMMAEAANLHPERRGPNALSIFFPEGAAGTVLHANGIMATAHRANAETPFVGIVTYSFDQNGAPRRPVCGVYESLAPDEARQFAHGILLAADIAEGKPPQ